MSDKEITRFVAAIQKLVHHEIRKVPRHHLATVTTVGPLTLTVDGDGDAQPAAYCKAYTPTIGDKVLVVEVRRELYVIDAIAASSSP